MPIDTDFKENLNPLPGTRSRYRDIRTRSDGSFAQKLAQNAANGSISELNFSRKREPPSSSSGNTTPVPPEDMHVSKRSKGTNWPLSGEDGDEKPLSPPRRSILQSKSMSGLGRASRFREGSMNDRPSAQPPSVFTRASFNPHTTNASEDGLMEDYMEATDAQAMDSTGRSASRATQRSGLTHHANTSISSNSAAALTSENKPSSIFRLSRSLASSMNPVNLWQKMSTNWRDSVNEVARELEEERDRQLVERQIRAEQAYAELKRAGQLGALGTRDATNAKKVFASGYTMPSENNNQRDSGIQMVDGLRYSFDSTSTMSQLPPTTAGSDMSTKRGFHLRTPSMQSLKRIRSEASLHMRTISGSFSTEKEPTDPSTEEPVCTLRHVSSRPEPTLRRSSSRKDIAKQVKLSKRVSDLETKLDAARRELIGVMAKAPSVTNLATEGMDQPARPVSRQTASRRGFEPLPTLPSESLLLPMDGAPSMPPTDHVEPGLDTHHRESTFQFSNYESIGFQSPAIATEPEPVSAFDTTSSEQSPDQPARKGFTRRRKQAIRDASRKLTGTGKDDNSEWTNASAKLIKKVRQGANSAIGSTTPKLQVNESRRKPRILTKARQPSQAGLVTTIDPRTGLETVQEEIANTTTVMLADVPLRPTAFATPAHPLRRQPHHRHIRSMSPVKSRRDYPTPGQQLQAHYRTRSISPLPEQNASKTLSPSFIRNAITVQPNGYDVPPLPSRDGKKDEWQWPEDVF